jgi:hypothetical protein
MSYPADASTTQIKLGGGGGGGGGLAIPPVGTISFVAQGNPGDDPAKFCIVCSWFDCVSFFHVPTLFPSSQIPKEFPIGDFAEAFSQSFELEKPKVLVLCKSYFFLHCIRY